MGEESWNTDLVHTVIVVIKVDYIKNSGYGFMSIFYTTGWHFFLVPSWLIFMDIPVLWFRFRLQAPHEPNVSWHVTWTFTDLFKDLRCMGTSPSKWLRTTLCYKILITKLHLLLLRKCNSCAESGLHLYIELGLFHTLHLCTYTTCF